MSDKSSENDLDAATEVGALSASQQVTTQFEHSCPAIPGYEVVRELGRGGMGVVYLARNHSLDRLVALKTFSVGCPSETGSALRAEARLSGKLNHPYIVPVFDVDASCSTPYFSMAFVEGENLAQRIQRAVLAPQDAARLGSQVADALDHAHGLDALHLDIKPANILLDKAGNAKVTDFGLFALVGTTSQGGSAVGTPQFMAPEQALSDSDNIGPRSDIYSLGAVLYAAMAGRPPLVGSNDTELLMKVASQRPKPLRSLAPRVPAALDAIVMKSLEKSPEHRYRSAAEMKADLDAFLAGKPIQARPHGWASWLRYHLEHHVLAASVSGSLVILLLLFTLISLVAQGVKNHYEVARLNREVDALESVNSQFRGAYVTALKQNTPMEQNHMSALAGELTEIAVQLSEESHDRLAAISAAEAYEIHQQLGAPNDPSLEPIIRRYKQLWNDDGEMTINEMAETILRENQRGEASTPEAPAAESL